VCVYLFDARAHIDGTNLEMLNRTMMLQRNGNVSRYLSIAEYAAITIESAEMRDLKNSNQKRVVLG
jgi:hypothetical protein